MLNTKHYKTSKSKFLYGYFVVFLIGASIGFLVRLLVGQYIIAVLDVIAIAIVLWVVYDYEKRHNIEFSSLMLFWMISLFMFYYIYHLGYDITIFQIMPIPVAAAMTLSSKTYKKHSLIFFVLFILLIGYGFMHKNMYPYLQDTKFIAEAFIILMFSFASGFVYHYSINTFNEKLQNTNALLEESNEEKTYLLKEVHHRVKNNLNMMTSILGLQEENADNQEILTFIRQNTLRIKSIALVHELLYTEQNFKTINLKNYIDNLLHHILSISKHSQLQIKTNIENIIFNTDDIIHIGIILNELMTNSLKYAFEENTKKRIDIILAREDNHYILHFKDNGKGIEAEELRNKGFGLSLVGLAIEHLEGIINIQSNDGLHTKITFKGTQS